MKFELAVSVFLGLFASLAATMCGKINVEPQRTGKRISALFGAVPVLLELLNVGGFNAVSFLLEHMQKNWSLIHIYILAAAVLAPALAFLDKRKSRTAVRTGYIPKNLGFNLMGAASAWAMLYVVHKEITDFRFIEEFYVQEIIVILIPVCLGIVLSYQAIEQEQSRREEMDHSPSLEWKNQICNILHLFNAYFWSLASAVFVAAYTIYCHIHHTQLYLNRNYLLFLSIALLFFYVCGVHTNEHVHMIFAIYVPVILINSMYWMSWFTADNEMMKLQMAFIVFHSLVYAFILYKKKEIIVIGRAGGRRDPAYQIHFNKVISIKIRHWFYVTILFVVVAAYVILWAVPLSIERMPYNKAANYISAICMDTSRNVDELLDEIRSREWWDDENEDVDHTRYLEFLYDNLRGELIEKGVITEEDKSLSYKKLDDWFDNLPRQYFENS